MKHEAHFVSRTDTRPEFFNFISGLRSDDLIAELIQNEIDAGSMHTVIVFQKDRLVCSGNGHSVDENGWLRLSYLRGAGDEVPRKRGLIGVKNHGLKACFTIGDDIFIRSSGQYTRQTLYQNGQDEPPSPAAFEKPLPDSKAPFQGCVIEVPYRTRAFKSTVGEPVSLDLADSGRIETLFEQAINDISDRFIGTVRPDLRKSYTIEVKHHRLGTVRFDFAARKGKREAGILWFIRTCKVRGDVKSLPSGQRERASLRSIARPKDISRDVSPFYEDGRRLLVEVSWAEDPKGKPLSARGALRYPISYPDTGEASLSGFAAHYSAPFASDTERHGLAGQASAWNSELREACDDLLLDSLKQLLRRHGSRALVLLDPEHAPINRLRPAVLALRERDALPVRRAKTFQPLLTRKIKQSEAIKKRSGTARRTEAPRLIPRGAKLVIPSYLGDGATHSHELAQAAPDDCWLLHPDVPSRIREILTDDDQPGWMDDRITFDENDALNRLRGIGHAGDDFFPWSDESAWRAGIGNVLKVRACLDAILRAGSSPGNDLLNPGESVYLPDANETPVALEELFLAAHVPTGILDLVMPRVVHQGLADHSLFRKKTWKRPAFRLTEFIDELQQQELSQGAARELFNWTKAAFKEIPQRNWVAFRSLPIWPNARGEFGSLERLCALPSGPIRRILMEVIDEPSTDLVKLAAGMKARRLSLPIRDVPSLNELQLWLSGRLKTFEFYRHLTKSEKTSYQALEKELSMLASEKPIVKPLQQTGGSIPALSRAGNLKPTAKLVRLSPRTNRIALQDGDISAERLPLLERIWPTQEQPTADMIRTALNVDPQNHEALIPRLQALIDCCDDDLGVGEVPCVPLHGKYFSPNDLCLKSNRGSYWGRKFKVEITGKNLSQVDQKLMVRAGVLPAEPNGEASQEFFAWLNQNEDQVEDHIPEILRHFLHTRSVTTWWISLSGVPCIPIEGVNGHKLVSYSEATRSSGRVFVNDFPELATAIRQDYRMIKLTVDSHEAVSTPITELLKDAGVRSLRRSCGDPKQVIPTRARPADAWVGDIVLDLKSPMTARALKKQLIKLELPQKYLRNHWQSRLQEIRDVKIADELSVRYRIGRLIQTLVRSVFDPTTGILWLHYGSDHSRDKLKDALFSALAARIFTEDAPLYCIPALQHAITIEIDEPETRRTTNAKQTSAAENGSIPGSEDLGPSEEPGAAPDAHHDWSPDPSKEVPSPGPLPTNASTTSKPPHTSSKRKPTRKRDALEEEQAAELKEKHYAWHCQIGLAERDPSKLAPRGSYAEAYQNRKKLIEAHHPDAVTARGARHAGNMLILSHFEHHRIGRHLSREQITEALKEVIPRTVRFGKGREAREVEGVVAQVQVRSTGEVVSIFFTRQHREYWLHEE